MLKDPFDIEPSVIVLFVRYGFKWRVNLHSFTVDHHGILTDFVYMMIEK
jgi:hypothetical protein